MNLYTLLNEFYQDNTTYLTLSFILLFIIFPVELVVISHVTSKIYSSLSRPRGKDGVKRIIFYCLIFVASFLFIEVCSHTRDHIESTLMPRLFMHFRTKILEFSLHSNDQFFEEVPTGELLIRLMRTPYISYQSFNVIFKYLLPTFLMVLISCIYVSVLSPALGLRISLLCFLQLWILCWAVIRCCWWNREEVKTDADFFENTEDVMSHLFVITSSGKIEEELQRLKNSQKLNFKAYQSELRFINATKRSISFSTICIVMYAIGMSMYYHTSRKSHQRGFLSMEKVVALITLFIFLARGVMPTAKRAMESVGYTGGMLDQNRFLMDIIGKMMIRQRELETLHSTSESSGEMSPFFPLGECQGNIVFENVSFSYSNIIILNHFSADFSRSTVIVGASGSGKSSILRLILGFYRPQEGAIFLDDRKINEYPKDFLRHNMALVNQTTGLFNRTVLENIMYENSKYAQEEAMIRLKDFLREHPWIVDEAFSHYFPDKKDETYYRFFRMMAGKNGTNFSGGQRQLILLLRCLFKPNAKIILMDEPTSALDPHSKLIVSKIIQTVFQNRTVICVTHDYNLVPFFPQAFMMKNGTCVPFHENSR